MFWKIQKYTVFETLVALNPEKDWHPNYHPRSQKESGKRRAKIIGQLEDLSYQHLCFAWYWNKNKLNNDFLTAPPGNASTCLEDCRRLPILKPKDLHCSGWGGRVNRPPQCHQLHPRGVWWSAWVPQHRGPWSCGLVELTCLWGAELCEIWLWCHVHLKSIGPIPAKWAGCDCTSKPCFPRSGQDSLLVLCLHVFTALVEFTLADHTK